MARPDPHHPISPPPATGALADELPAYVSNDLIGLRVRDVPLIPGMVIVSGFVGEHHERHVEAAVAAPYPLGGDIALDGVWASEVMGGLEPMDQSYDFATAELTTRFRVRLPAGAAMVEVVTLASRSHPTVICQETTITLDQACELTFRARVDPAGCAGRWRNVASIRPARRRRCATARSCGARRAASAPAGSPWRRRRRRKPSAPRNPRTRPGRSRPPIASRPEPAVTAFAR